MAFPLFCMNKQIRLCTYSNSSIYRSIFIWTRGANALFKKIEAGDVRRYIAKLCTAMYCTVRTIQNRTSINDYLFSVYADIVSPARTPASHVG